MIRTRSFRACVLAVCVVGLGGVRTATAAEWFVKPGGTGTGTASAPFGKIQEGIAAAKAGDTVTVAAGTYAETLRTVRDGTASARIVIRAADDSKRPVVTVAGRLLTVSHAYVTIDGLVLDGQYGDDDGVRIEAAAAGTILRRCEVRRSQKDGVDIGAASDVLIEDCLIHHALNARGGRTDAHGIVASAVRRLTIRNTEIHTFSGDGVQVDPGRRAPGWDDVTIEGCRIWLAPLTAAANGFKKGVVPGENAVDTKANASLARAHLTITNTDAYGFQGGLISNMAAYNIKENVDVVIDRTTVHASDIAFRLRGGGDTGAWVRISNAVVYDTARAFRYEDNIQKLRIWNSTVGSNVTRPFQNASSAGSVLDVRNLLVLGSSLPAEARDASNRAVAASAFVNAAGADYRLAAGSPAIDAGVAIGGVTTDRAGVKRPQGGSFDVGAHEKSGSGSSSGVEPADDVVLDASTAPVVVGNWTVATDDATGRLYLESQDLGGKTVTPAAATPGDYFELRFAAEAGRPYHLWLRLRADRDKKANDATWVQFSDATDKKGKAVYRIGSTSGTPIALLDCGSCRLSGWGWQDNGYGVGAMGPDIYFESSGTHTLRVQVRQDGVAVDQIVLSGGRYLTASPGRLTDDTTVIDPAGAR